MDNKKDFLQNEEGNEIKEEVNNATPSDVNDSEFSDSDLNDVFTDDENVDGGQDNNGSGEGEDGDTLTPGPEVSNDDFQDGSQNIEEGGEDMIEDSGEDVMDESQETKEKMIAQSKVNEIAARARQEGRDSVMKELLAKYGVNNDTELDDLFGKGQSYVDLDNDYNLQGENYRDALAENALLKSRIDIDRWEDVKLILTGKGLEVNPENIEAQLVSHPEWRSNDAQQLNGSNSGGVFTPEMGKELSKQVGANETQKPTVLKKLGNEASPEPQVTERELARKLYGFK